MSLRCNQEIAGSTVQYRNPWNHIRMGRVLEDMDSMAGNIAFVHCDDGDPATLPPMLVTAAVERIEMIHSVDLEHDATLCASLYPVHLFIRFRSSSLTLLCFAPLF